MSGYDLSVCVFIKDTFKGAFCLFESMATLMPLADEFIVMDLGSTDGTLEILNEIAEDNKKLKIINAGFPFTDANAFAVLANDVIAECKYDNVLYYQSDEIWHEDLVSLMVDQFDKGIFDLSFWRVQLRENFQDIKWFPHVVHRVGQKNKFNFVGDGMNTDRFMEPDICSTYDGGWFIRWGDEFKDMPTRLPTNEMIMDVSLVGAFLENIPDRRKMHAPFWHEQPDIEGKPLDEWMRIERLNKNWFRRTTPFNIPKIMKVHLGNMRYVLDDNLLEQLKGDRSIWRI